MSPQTETPAPPATRPTSRSRLTRWLGAASQTAPPKLDLTTLEDRTVPAGQVTGTAFLDYNANGLFDTAARIPTSSGTGTAGVATDAGVQGVVVTAYDAAGAVQGTAQTGAIGQYTLTLTGTGPYRLQFSGLPAGDFFGANGGTAVRFVPDGTSANVNLGLVRPGDTYPTAPVMWSNQYSTGDQTGTLAAGAILGAPATTRPVLVAFPYQAGTTSQTDNAGASQPAPLLSVTAAQVGTTWGLAQNARTNEVLAASFTKRHAGYGPLGSGGIYRVNATTGAVSTFWDANDAVTGGNFRSGYANNDDYVRDSDNTGWDAVGKTGFGGLAVNDDGTVAYVMNLADRRLYVIPINADGSANVAGITSYAVPVPSNASGVTAADPLGDIRPFAVEFHNGKVYVGEVNTAESTVTYTGIGANRTVTGPGEASRLRAYVYEFDPAGNTFGRSVLNEGATEGVSLAYARGTSYGGTDNFHPWVQAFTQNLSGSIAKYPQPVLSGLAFDAAGNLILGVRDRAGDQTGRFIDDNPRDRVNLYEGVSSGDILKAFPLAGGTFRLESNGEGLNAHNDGQGPGGGEFFNQDDYSGTSHNETALGGVAAVPGFPDVATTTFTPVRQNANNNYRSAGVRWYSDADGSYQRAYYLYTTDQAGTFGKAGGVGDLIALKAPAGREIGNRIWNDLDGNGRQDPGEPGIQGVQVVLTVDGAPLATATTDASGEYYFSSNAGTDPADGSRRFNLNLSAVGAYTIRVAAAQTALSGLRLTTPNAAGTDDQNDSDGVNQAGVAVAPVTLPPLGTSDTSYDVGYVAVPPPPPPGSLSGFVYVDADNDGVFDPGETPIQGVDVSVTGVLPDGTLVPPSVFTTLADGSYSFTGLQPGRYTVSESQPRQYLDGLDTPGTPGGGTAPQDDTIRDIQVVSNVNSPDNNFGELLPPPPLGALSGHVYADANDNGRFDAGETPLSGVTVYLRGPDGNGGSVRLTSTTTDQNGFYRFTGLTPGGYEVEEPQPPVYRDGKDAPGSTGGLSITVGTTDFLSPIAVPAGGESIDNDFGELLPTPQPPGALSGHVYVDANNNGVFDAGETPLSGVTVWLRAPTPGGGSERYKSAVTDGNGFYRFADLLAAPDGIDRGLFFLTGVFAQGTFEVEEPQPAGYLDGKDAPGTTGGRSITVGTTDYLSPIRVPAGGESFNNDFGELLSPPPSPPPGTLSGHVYVDANNNGVKDRGETPLAGVTVYLRTPDGVGGSTRTTSVFTDAVGFYQFTDLTPGVYEAEELLPAGYSNGKFAVGSTGGAKVTLDTTDYITAVAVPVNGASVNNDFGETVTIVPPPFPPPVIPTPHDPTKVNYLGSTSGIGSPGGSAGQTVLPSLGKPAFSALSGAGVPTYTAVGSGEGTLPRVRVFDYTTGAEAFRFNAFEEGFAGGVRVAVGDVTGDGVSDIVAAAGPGGGARVRVFDGRTGAVVRDFLAYSADFRGGVYVAAADVDGDGRADVITGAGAGGGPHVEVFSGASGQVIRSFFAYDAAFSGGVNVAAADVTGDGKADIVTGTASGAPHVKVFDGATLNVARSFFAYDPSSTGGVNVSAADVTGDGLADVITGAGAGGLPQVNVYDGGTGLAVRTFLAYDSTFSGGVRVAARDLNGDGKADVITGAGLGGASHVQVFSGTTGAVLDSFFAADLAPRTGVYVG